VKAFKSIFGGVLAEDKPLDVFFAGRKVSPTL
jgi:hypothetical protein